ncbi:hypothetical protein GCM10009702_10890 [Propioniferax innocua]
MCNYKNDYKWGALKTVDIPNESQDPGRTGSSPHHAPWDQRGRTDMLDEPQRINAGM